MKTLIVYGTTYGYTQDCSQRLKNLLQGDAEILDAKSALNLSLEPYDQIIIGGSIYMGQVQKSVRNFCSKQLVPLQKKRIGLFLCCGQPENYNQALSNAFPEELRRTAVCTENFGGLMDPTKMSLIHRGIIKMVTKASAGAAPPMLEIPENIQRMADTMRVSQ